MSWPRLLAVLLSVGVHAGVIYAILPRLDSFALQSGHGTDDLTVIATVSVENGDIFGTAQENQEAHDATPALNPASQPKPPEEPKPETVAKLESPKTEEPEPIPPEEPKPEEKPVEKEPEAPQPQPKPVPQAPAQAATLQVDEQIAAKALEGRRTKLASVYQGQIFTALVRHRVVPRSSLKGRVVLVLTIAPSGQLMSHEVVQSSGSAILDGAAIASLEKAAPFPPIPHDLSAGPYTIRVPFEYSTR